MGFDAATGRMHLEPGDVERVVHNVVATHRLDGIYPTEDEINKLREYANGKITKAEYMTWVLSKAGVK